MATLTYADAPPELIPDDMSGFMRKLRSIYPAPIRFYGVGEYGDLRGRPHFHLALFGVSILDSEFIGKAWEHGSFHICELNHQTAQYLCGYVTKKMNKKDDVRLKGKHPEFARMSLRPGIGANALATLKGALAPNGDVTLMRQRGDVPETIKVGGKEYPLGRYLREKLREQMGWEKTTPPEVKAAREAEYLARPEVEVQEIERSRENHYNRAKARVKIERSKKRL